MCFICLLGAPNIGRRSLKTRLLSEYSTRFGEVRARKDAHDLYVAHTMHSHRNTASHTGVNMGLSTSSLLEE